MIKDVGESLAIINSSLMNQELIQYTVDGLDDEYETSITIATYFEANFTFDDLHTKSILYKPRVLHTHKGTSCLNHPYGLCHCYYDFLQLPI